MHIRSISLLMSTHKIYFYGAIKKIILKIASKYSSLSSLLGCMRKKSSPEVASKEARTFLPKERWQGLFSKSFNISKEHQSATHLLCYEDRHTDPGADKKTDWYTVVLIGKAVDFFSTAFVYLRASEDWSQIIGYFTDCFTLCMFQNKKI